MPEEIVIKRRTLMAVLLGLLGLGLFILYQQLPDIRREIRIWSM